MTFENPYPLSAYQDIAPLQQKEHVILTQNIHNKQLCLKKHLHRSNAEIYLQLKKNPISGIPAIYGVYEQETQESSPQKPDARLIVIEEYLAGSTLAEHLAEKGVFTEKEILGIGLQLCAILKKLHKAVPPIIHRDIKPSNVLLTPEDRVYLIDFDAAKTVTSHHMQDTVLMGTAGFAAPEQYGFAASSPQTDIYALGVLFNTLRTGALPSQKLAEGRLKRIIKQCMQIDPRNRYLNIRELERALKRALAVKAEWLPPGFRTMRIYKILIALAGYAFLAAVTLSTDFDFLVMGFLTIAFYCNYLHIQRIFPLMRSKYTGLRILGLLLGPWVIVVGYAIFTEVILKLLFPASG